MKYWYFCAIFTFGFFFAFSQVHAASLSDTFAGRILLQVQEKGKAWYIDPVTKTRAYLGRPSDAFRVMRELGLGISNANLGKISTSDEHTIRNRAFAQKFAGRILLQVEEHGESWYVNPVDLKRYFLGRPSDAFKVMRGQGLGISNENIDKITTAEKYADPEQQIRTSVELKSDGVPASQTPSFPAQKPILQPSKPVVLSTLENTPTSERVAGSYRCWSYNVSGGGGGDCRLFAPIVLNTDGTYSVSSEKGTYSVKGDIITLSESKLRGPGTLIGGTQIRFEYDYNGWHHVITYLKEGGTSAVSSGGTVSEVPVQITLEYPEKDSSLNSLVTMELVPEGQDVKEAKYKPTAIAVWDGNRSVTASFHKTTNTPQTGKKYDVYANWGIESTKVGQIDLTNAKNQVVTSITIVNVGGTSVEQKKETPSAPQKTYITIDLTLQYSPSDTSLNDVTRIDIVKQGDTYYPGYGKVAGYGNTQQLIASFSAIEAGYLYDVYTSSYTSGGKKVGILDVRAATGNVSKILEVK